MDIAGVSMALSQTDTLGKVGTAVLGMNLDLMKTEGNMLASSLASMPSPSLESLVYPNTMGQNIDMTV